ncbi:WYL domain-containing protein [Sanguibacter hominis ATCC BAA-789]|uniref:WYL domain-containing protein n=1 Tax=Sanguibacter hominis ATCC BAA-789 TaxID=1312740 RepID=A0A9X5ISZ4_9MICO|nr:WYL domain-containing protein [Sanguibacter hominis ATCC BAA-789]
MKRTERLHALSETLRRSGPRGCTAQRLATDLGVSVRTIKRDLAALDAAGTPVWSRPGPGGGYGLAARTSLPPVSLSPAQAVALLAAVSAARDAPFADLAATGVRKVLDVLDPVSQARAEQLAGRIWVDSAPASRRTWSALEQAMAERRVVRIRFVARDGAVTTRDVDPVLFAQAGGSWYLIGWCRLRRAMRWFLVARIARASVTSTPCDEHAVADVGVPPAGARPVHEGPHVPGAV